MEGLRYLPRVHAWRRKMMDHPDSPTPPEIANRHLDCGACVEEMSSRIRATMNCGLLPADERQQGGPFPECDVCPGYTMTLPEVQEATRALAWRKDGELRSFYDEPLTPLAKDCIDLLGFAIAEQESAAIREMRQRK